MTSEKELANLVGEKVRIHMKNKDVIRGHLSGTLEGKLIVFSHGNEMLLDEDEIEFVMETESTLEYLQNELSETTEDLKFVEDGISGFTKEREEILEKIKELTKKIQEQEDA